MLCISMLHHRCASPPNWIFTFSIMVAIEEYDENVCYLQLASFPWGKTASIRQVNENRMIPRSANAGISKRCCYAIGVSHWKQPCSVGVPRPKDAPEPWLCPSTTNDFPLKNPLQRFAASVCMFMVIHGDTSSWCWQLLIIVDPCHLRTAWITGNIFWCHMVSICCHAICVWDYEGETR
jgi:hypothetical protein